MHSLLARPHPLPLRGFVVYKCSLKYVHLKYKCWTLVGHIWGKRWILIFCFKSWPYQEQLLDLQVLNVFDRNCYVLQPWKLREIGNNTCQWQWSTSLHNWPMASLLNENISHRPPSVKNMSLYIVLKYSRRQKLMQKSIWLYSYLIVTHPLYTMANIYTSKIVRKSLCCSSMFPNCLCILNL